MDQCFFCPSLMIVLLGGVCRSQIVKAPSHQIVSSNGMATFNCSMSCSQQLPVTWYLTLPTNARTVAVSPFTSLSQIKSIYGIDVSRETANECSQGGYFVEQLFVKSQQQLNLMPVQCSTVCSSGDCSCDTTQVYFSKLAVLSVLEVNSGPYSAPSSTATTTRLSTMATTAASAATPVLCPSSSLQVPDNTAASVITIASGMTRHVTITATATTSNLEYAGVSSPTLTTSLTGNRPT